LKILNPRNVTTQYAEPKANSFNISNPKITQRVPGAVCRLIDLIDIPIRQHILGEIPLRQPIPGEALQSQVTRHSLTFCNDGLTPEITPIPKLVIVAIRGPSSRRIIMETQETRP